MNNINYQYQKNPWTEIKTLFKGSSVLSRLILINIVIWLIISLLRIFAFLFNVDDVSFQYYIIEYLALPASFETLIFRPWTIITYMFLHISFFHILFNMLWLYWFGKIFLQYLNSKQLLGVYIWGGIAGGLLFMLAYNIFPAFQDIVPQAKALGASASVMAIVTAISFYRPNFYIHLLFFGRIKIIYLAIALFVIDFFMIRSSNSGGHIAHIGGFIYGFIYIYLMKKGKYPSGIFNFGGLGKYFIKNKKSNFEKTFYNQRPLSDDDYNKKKVYDQKKMDDILDKISKYGYDKLTKEEKEFLFKSSNKN